MFLPILIEHGQVCDFLEVFLGRWIVVDLDVALEISGRIFDGHVGLVEGGGWVLPNGVNPKEERYESYCEEYSEVSWIGE